MRRPEDYLAPTDFDVLGYLSHTKSVKVDDVIAHFAKTIPSIEHRLEFLSRHPGDLTHSPSGWFIVIEHFHGSASLCRITENGLISYENYKASKRSDLRRLLLKNAWIPIGVSIITNLVIDAIRWLLPRLQEWVSSFLS